MAAQGVKIAAKELEKAIAGLRYELFGSTSTANDIHKHLKKTFWDLFIILNFILYFAIMYMIVLIKEIFELGGRGKWTVNCTST